MSKVLVLLEGGDKSSLVYVNSELMCDFFARFESLLVVEGGMGDKLLSNWMTALLLNGGDWLLKTVTDRMLRDTKLAM